MSLRTTSEIPLRGDSENGVSSIDENRRKAAMVRVRRAVGEAKYHDTQAAAARGKAQTLVRTWQLCPAPENFVRFENGCCGNPDECGGKTT